MRAPLSKAAHNLSDHGEYTSALFLTQPIGEKGSHVFDWLVVHIEVSKFPTHASIVLGFS